MLGQHPDSGADIKLMDGRFGPYVSDGTIHATLPKSADKDAVTIEEALELIAAKAAKGGGGKAKKKAPARKAAKPAAKAKGAAKPAAKAKGTAKAKPAKAD